MFQLKFNDDFTNITRYITHWKNQEDIPEKIKKFIIDTSDMRVIYEKDSGKYYCGKCTRELDSSSYCKNCGIKHKTYTLEDVKNHFIDIKVIDKKVAPIIYNDTCNYFVFDISGENVYLYLIKEEITYYNPVSELPYKKSTMYIDASNSYYIEKDGMTNLDTNIFTPFKMLDDYSKKLETNDFDIENEENFEIFDIFENFELDIYNAYIYTDNLTKLKNTIYKYTKIWELNTYLKKQHSFQISQFTFYPLYYPQFEYLINYKLYNLAFEVPNWFKSGKNFKEIFGVDKYLLPFMQENDITGQELRILSIYPTTDIQLLRFFSRYCFDEPFIEIIKENKIDLKELKEYLEDKNYSLYGNDYLDYLYMAKELKLNLKDKKVLYPNNLREAHDELYNQIEVVNNPIIDEKIKKLSYMLSFNKYEDNNYVIYPATSIKDLVDESRQQKNCVRTYCERVANNNSQIYFMREKQNLEKSLVTIEVNNKKIVQARVKYNELPSDELCEILHKWEQNLIPIVNEC